MLKRIVEERWFTPKAVIGFWPANAIGDDIALYAGESREERLATLHTLRQQLARRDGKPNVALADFVAPKDSGKADYIGAFVVTAGAEEEKISARYARANDDYGSIMVKALADRIAEAFAERMHERARREFWGYASEREFFARRSCRTSLIAAFARRPAIPRSPTTRKRRRCSGCSTRRSAPACG